MNTRVRRVLLAHGLAAAGMGLPWPVLLVLVDLEGSPLLLGVAGAARLAPYVVLSWWSGRLADRRERARIVRLSLVARVVLLLMCAAAIAAGQTWLAVAAATLAIAAGTPAYPALAAGMPRLAGAATPRATSLLVTVEVSSFVVGPALGGLAVGRGPAPAAAVVGAVLCLGAALLFRGTVLPAPERVEPGHVAAAVLAHEGPGIWPLLRANRSARHALVVVAVVNGALSALGLALLELAEHVWETGEQGFGIATAVLGCGALVAPVLAGFRPMASARGCLLVMAGAIAAVGLLPASAAVVALAAVGAVSTCCENVATGVIQASVPDARRASVLGLADSLMVGAALVAAVTAPWLAGLLGAIPLVLAVAAGTAVLGLSQVRRPHDLGVTGSGGPLVPGRLVAEAAVWERAAG